MLNQEKGMRFQPTDQKANAEYNLEDIVLQIVDKIPITVSDVPGSFAFDHLYLMDVVFGVGTPNC